MPIGKFPAFRDNLDLGQIVNNRNRYWDDPDDPVSGFYAKWLGIQVTVEYEHEY